MSGLGAADARALAARAWFLHWHDGRKRTSDMIVDLTTNYLGFELATPLGEHLCHQRQV